MTTLPYRPRLAAHGLLRHHRVAGRSLFVIHDTRSHEMIELQQDQLVALLGCDGTRDLGGVLLATAREGAYRRASSIEALLHELARRGLLEDGIAPRFAAAPTTSSRPLEPLPGYRLRCEGHGSCCKSFGSIAFTESEAAEALRAVPEVADVERIFLPLQGSTYDGVCAVALRDAHCTFLGEDGRCEIHRRAGSAHKPLGCQLYPRSFADDGEAVRVSVRLECPCVFTSLEHADGEPLSGELAPGTHVPALGSDGAAIRRWSNAVLAALPERGDGFAILWSLSQSVAAHGFDGVSIDEAPRWDELPPLFARLARRTSARAQSAAGWRAPEDRVRQLAEWLDRAARALAAGARFDEPHADEAFYVRAIIHGHQAALMDPPLASALLDLAVRVLLARAALVHTSEDDPMAQHPLSAVETMMRAQGLAGWLAQES